MDGLMTLPTQIGAINKAEKVQQRHCRYDEEVNFESESAFGNSVKYDGVLSGPNGAILAHIDGKSWVWHQDRM